jgi:uncharacterized RDD family membrane protein YckC
MMGRRARRFIPVLGFWQLSVIYHVNDFLNSSNPEKPMTRDEHLLFCKVCINRAFDPQLGIVCSLTRQHANFDPTCPDFKPQPDAATPSPFSNNPYEYRGSVKINVQAAMATSGQRLANYFIDRVVILILFFMSIFILAILFAASGESIDEEGAGFTFFSYLILFAVHIGYYAIMESVFGRTVGKFVSGTCVVDSQGRTPEAQVIILRTLSRLVPFEAFSFLGTPARGWHDQWTDTWVVEYKSS